jgi:hypothetical protein
MSKNRNVNSPNSFGESTPDVESLLKLAAPEDVALDRDALMFQAGLRSASDRRASRLVWPAIAATLMLLCTVLGIAFFGERQSADRLQVELAKLQEQQKVDREIQASPRSLVVAEQSSDAHSDLTRNSRIRGFVRLSSNSSLASGQLTAAGWERRTTAPDSEAHSAVEREVGPRRERPATYRELLESFQEG